VSSGGQEIHIRRLEPQDNRSGFRSGNIDLDRFFQRYAGQNQFRHHVGTTYVAVQGDQITGFTTVSSGELAGETVAKALRRRLPTYPLPVLRLARLAVDQRFKGHGIGRLLLRAMLELALEMRDRVGCVGVVVDAKPEAVDFYAGLGFRTMRLISGSLGDRPEPIAMFLPIREIAAAARRADKNK
jgi:GNAT superfamily N-acetyltransferase